MNLRDHQWIPGYISKGSLVGRLRRGGKRWTKQTVQKFLGEPDMIIDHPDNPNKTLSLYSLERIRIAANSLNKPEVHGMPMPLNKTNHVLTKHPSLDKQIKYVEIIHNRPNKSV